MIAALFVAKNGCYFNVPGIDPWDEARDARKYAGPNPVVAHPPCSAWSKLAPINQKRWGRKIGDDGGCFKAALIAIRVFGGVLEHPAGSRAWAHFGLLKPVKGQWTLDKNNGMWVCEVSQSAYGHKARKKTWLLANVKDKPADLNWSDPKGTHYVSNLSESRYDYMPRLSKKEALATPPAFRDALLSIARVPCDCGSDDATWHGDTLREYCCDSCYASSRAASAKQHNR